MSKDYKFYTRCDNTTEKERNYFELVKQDAKEITRETFIGKVPTEELQKLFPFYTWGSGKNGGLKMKDDWHVQYLKSETWLIIRHSSWEYYFTQDYKEFQKKLYSH